MVDDQDHLEGAAGPTTHADSLFAEIVLRTSAHPENIATEALAYLLRKYTDCWQSLRAYLALAGVELPARLSFRTQAVGEDDAVPDLVGFDSKGDALLTVESKFWAALTPAQPVGYLRRLPADEPAILLVVAPGQRFASLWDTLADRCRAEGIPVENPTDVVTEFRRAAVARHHVLALTSWRGMLALLSRDAEVRNAHALLADLRQLQGLCLRMDNEAFLPLDSRDLAPAIGRRVRQFVELVDEAVNELAARHGASTKGLTWGGSPSTRGRYFRLSGLGGFLCYSPDLWGRSGDTPIWLRVKEDLEDGSWVDSPRLRDVLWRAFADRPSRVVATDEGPAVAIDLPLGVQRGEVVASIVAQITTLRDALALARIQSDPSSPTVPAPTNLVS